MGPGPHLSILKKGDAWYGQEERHWSVTTSNLEDAGIVGVTIQAGRYQVYASWWMRRESLDRPQE